MLHRPPRNQCCTGLRGTCGCPAGWRGERVDGGEPARANFFGSERQRAPLVDSRESSITDWHAKRAAGKPEGLAASNNCRLTESAIAKAKLWRCRKRQRAPPFRTTPGRRSVTSCYLLRRAAARRFAAARRLAFARFCLTFLTQRLNAFLLSVRLRQTFAAEARRFLQGVFILTLAS